MKKVWSLALASMMVVSLLSGCGGGNTTPTKDSASASKSATATDPVESEENESNAEDAGTNTEASSNDLIIVGYAQVGAESDWRTANTESFKSTFTEENGYQLIFDDAQQKQENQVKAIRNFIAQEVDYIVLAPVVETGWETVLGEARDAGIPVILSDRMVDVSDDSLYECWVGGNFELEGEKGVEWLDQYLTDQNLAEEEINVVMLQGTIGASAEVGRTAGVEKNLQTIQIISCWKSKPENLLKPKGRRSWNPS